jgi:hypothetical protein
MLALEEPKAHVLWLGKGLPRLWLAEGERVSALRLPTAYGRVDLVITSSIESAGTISANVTVPTTWAAVASAVVPPAGGLTLRLRAPVGKRMVSVTVDGGLWMGHDAAAETVHVTQAQLRAPGMRAKLQRIVVKYSRVKL